MEEWDNIISYFVDAGLIALILNIIMMISSIFFIFIIKKNT